MDNIAFFPRTAEAEQLCTTFGFTHTLFSDSVALLQEADIRKLIQNIQQQKQKQKLVIVHPGSEEQLRAVLEKTSADMVMGLESIHPKDSLHYVRSGLDQVLCSIAAKRQKTVAFSFASLLQTDYRPKLLARMMFNIQLCRKYGVSTFFGNFSSSPEELRSKKDLQALQRLLERG